MEQPCTSRSNKEITETSKKKIRRRGRRQGKKTSAENSAPPSKTPSLHKIEKKSSKTVIRSPKAEPPKVIKTETRVVKTVNNVQEKVKGVVYRKRDPNAGSINLQTFAHGNGPVIFKTGESIISKLSKLTLDEDKRKTKKRKKLKEFPPFITLELVEEGLKNGTLLKGIIRINPKNGKESYIGNEDHSKSDYVINSVLDRNRAFEGDEVVFEVKDERSAKVVYILRRNHPRSTVGYLRLVNKLAEFTSRDKRIPKVVIPPISWPNMFQENPKLYANNLFVVQITDWVNPSHADGLITENLGLSGDLKIESLAILKEFSLDCSSFPPEEVDIIRSDLGKIDYENRENLTEKCIFTIDPATAKDLDDAVSCEMLPDGNFEVGVHISDASYFLKENTILDDRVRNKATSIYLVEQVYHMLPLELCLNCSLLPNCEKLAFSVIWVLTPTGDIVDKRITRSVIKSCAQLSYEHAQNMIDRPNDLDPDQFPIIYNFPLEKISEVVNNLHKISVHLKEKRVEGGALRIDQIKISFSLDPTDGKPSRFWVYENKPAHRLIEEFMLLANITVAEWIADKYPDLAFLRCHDPPKQTMINELQDTLETVGIFLDSTTSGSLSRSLNKYSNNEYEDFLGQCRGVVLNHLLTKPMVRARYFCAGFLDDNDFHHYALSVPIYTHFTSPIRRYADIMVHRLLAASLGYREKPNYKPEDVALVAENCNRQKYNAKRAGEASIDLYLAHFIENHQPFIEAAVVVDCKDRSIDVIIIKTGSIVRLYTNNFDKGVKWEVEQINKTNDDNGGKKLWRMTVQFPKNKKHKACSLVLEIFSFILVKLTRKPETNKLDGKLVRPDADG